MDLRVVGRHPVCLVDLAEPKFHLNAVNKPGHVTRADGNKTHSGPTPPARPSEGTRCRPLYVRPTAPRLAWSGLLSPPCTGTPVKHTLCHIRDASFVRRSSSSPTIACWRRATWWMDVYGARSAASYMKTFSARCTRWPGSTTRMRSGRWDPLHRHPRDRCRRPL